MFDLNLTGWLVAAISAALVGLSKAGLPGAGILAIPMFATILPARASTGALLPILIAGDILAVALYRRHAAWSHVLRILPWSLTGVVLGYVVMGHVSDAVLRPAIGVIVLGMLAINYWRNRQPDLAEHIPTGTLFAAGMGLLAGSLTMLANAAGPVMVIYLLAMRLPKQVFIGTAAWYFFIVNILKVPFSAQLGLIGEDSLAFNGCLLPAVAAGAGIGWLTARRIPEKAFNGIVQILAALGAAKLLF